MTASVFVFIVGDSFDLCFSTARSLRFAGHFAPSYIGNTFDFGSKKPRSIRGGATNLRESPEG